MIYPRPDCRAIYVALEGEAFTAPDNKFVVSTTSWKPRYVGNVVAVLQVLIFLLS